MRTAVLFLLAGVLLAGCGAFGGSAAYPNKTITIEPHAFVFYEGVSPVTKDGKPGAVTGEVNPLIPGALGDEVPSNRASSAQDAQGNSRCFIVTINANDAPAQDSESAVRAEATATTNSPSGKVDGEIDK